MLTLTTPETIAAYIRVSTYDQRTGSQREEISRWLKNHGIDPERIQRLSGNKAFITEDFRSYAGQG